MTEYDSYISELQMENSFEGLQEVKRFSDISYQYDALICDIWGVIHNGQELFPGINECLLNYKEQNNHVILLSNAPRPSSYVKTVLDKFGFKSDCYDDIITLSLIHISEPTRPY